MSEKKSFKSIEKPLSSDSSTRIDISKSVSKTNFIK